jgi:LuxR family maltose regulon positive regulatory protein
LTYQARGQEQDARAAVADAIKFFLTTGNAQLLIMMKAFQAELALRQNRLTFASQWASQFDPVPPLSPMYMMYDPHLTLVKVWLAENTASSLQKAADLLARLETFLESTHNDAFLLETLILKAAYLQRRGNVRKARASLHRALTLAMPGEFIRLFLDLWPFVGELFYQIGRMKPEQQGFKEQIMAALPLSDRVHPPLAQNDDSARLVDPLTDRETQVVALLVKRQTDREIAKTLKISPHTVRTHTKNIYAKLGVNNRWQAAERAIELGLLTS